MSPSPAPSFWFVDNASSMPVWTLSSELPNVDSTTVDWTIMSWLSTSLTVSCFTWSNALCKEVGEEETSLEGDDMSNRFFQSFAAL